MNATTAIILDKRIKRKDDTYAVKLRITFNRVQQYYPLNIHLSPDEWEKTNQPNPRGESKQLKTAFNIFENKAIQIIRDLSTFSFPAFNKLFLNESYKEKADTYSYIENYMKELTTQERINTASSFKSTITTLKNFINDKRRISLPFDFITPEFLTKLEKWLLENGKSITTVGIYSRNIRTIMNLAIEDGKLDKENYPFGKRKYQIPSSRNVKKAAAKTDLKSLLDYLPNTENEAWGRDMWLLSYLCNGANVKDIVLLKDKNIEPKSIQFIRSKTERSTKQDQKPIVIMRIPKIDEIIERWGLKNRTPNTYVFGLVNENDSAVQIAAKIKEITKRINKYMKRICENLCIDVKLTTYSARHSFSTMLKLSGASTEFISESLGHKDLKTTENYLDSFEDETKLAFQNKLLEF